MSAKSRPLSEDQLLRWVQRVVQREAKAGTYGTITFHLEAGVVTRAKIERSEMPHDELLGEKPHL